MYCFFLDSLKNISPSQAPAWEDQTPKVEFEFPIMNYKTAYPIPSQAGAWEGEV